MDRKRSLFRPGNNLILFKDTDMDGYQRTLERLVGYDDIVILDRMGHVKITNTEAVDREGTYHVILASVKEGSVSQEFIYDTNLNSASKRKYLHYILQEEDAIENGLVLTRNGMRLAKENAGLTTSYLYQKSEAVVAYNPNSNMYIILKGIAVDRDWQQTTLDQLLPMISSVEPNYMRAFHTLKGVAMTVPSIVHGASRKHLEETPTEEPASVE
jgi:hypothetical protein